MINIFKQNGFVLIVSIKAVLVFITTLGGMLLVMPKLRDIASTLIVTKGGTSTKMYSLMDNPDKVRKVHNIPKPLVGGIGMIIVVSLSSIIFVPPDNINLRGYYSAVIMLGVVGFLDDFSDLHYSWKLIAQVMASSIMIYYSKTALSSFGDLLSFGSIDLGYFMFPVTVFCTIGVINAINMIDGLDGLAGGVSLIAFISFAILAFINGQIELMLLSLALSGSVLGFLKFNWYPSTLFMGDAGSFFLGFSLAFLSISITQGGYGIVPPMAALMILAIPIADTLTVMIKRMLRGKSPFFADKTHLHHMLLSFGLKINGSVIVILALSLISSITAILGTVLKVSDYNMFFIFVIVFLVYFFAMFSVKYD
ncbi:MAG: undecaprenyl/decaprenyl-phosphate alpha-N-acetylglucosaminyl 1-phosphate transferase [Nitrospirae bacterium]|nr:undecaprenyl/decaprenyl-phosphate alpha-N-acetylglucosaminyl 1-phosphate transferase [Nitrospirota bacterium]